MSFFVTRQPIFDRQLNTSGYKLLYSSRETTTGSSEDINNTNAAVVVNSFINMGIETFTRSKKAFINFNKQLLEQGAALLLPSQLAIIELNGTIHPDEEMLNICKNLRANGYKLVLDDFSYSLKDEPLVGYANLLKVDLSRISGEELENITEYARMRRINVIAKNIDNKEDYLKAKELGCTYFQGYFFCMPEIIQSKDIPEIKIHYLQLLREIYKPDINFDILERLIKQDVALSYKLLKFINSVEFKLRFEIRSIRQAIALLGQKHLIRWASLVSLRSIGQDKPSELIITALTRARFCEELAAYKNKGQIKDDLFLVGLFSLLDVFLSRPLEDILHELPLAEAINDALMGVENELSPYYHLALAYERADWSWVEQEITNLGLNDQVVANSYQEALMETEKMVAY